jgi:hypothetical protein
VLDKENVKGKKFLRFLMNARQFPSKEYDDDDFISTRFEKNKRFGKQCFHFSLSSILQKQEEKCLKVFIFISDLKDKLKETFC